MEEGSLYRQLHKLATINSEEAVDEILTALWKTRRTGLPPPQKSHFQSLLDLPSLSELDPVLACLRSLIRKCVHENVSGDDLLKLFPPDLSLSLQSTLVLSLHKFRDQWKEEVLNEQQHPPPRTAVSYQVKAMSQPVFSSLPSSDNLVPLFPRDNSPGAYFNHSSLGISSTSMGNATAADFATVSVQHDSGPIDNLGVLPHLKSMTWKMANRNSASANGVAIIFLKLQDHAQSPSGEIEVKFQLTRDTIEAMLRSLTYICEQLSNKAGTSSEPAQKKQKE